MKPLQIADLFCGAGGSTTGIRQAVERMGRKANILAINHWDVAIQTHSVNNEGVEHLCETVTTIDPTRVVPGQELDLLWASPACTHHSVARGGRPRCEQQRAPAWIIPFWLENLKVKRLVIENVPEFQNWGPLDDDGKPIKEKKGETFKVFLDAIRSQNYTVEYRVLNAANYGDPTIRRRLFIIAIKGQNRQIKWPRVTHAESQYNVHGLPKWVPARDIIDWSIPGTSIFNRKKPLAEATLRRIAVGIEKHCKEFAQPFLAVLHGTSTVNSLDEPLSAVLGTGHHALVQPIPMLMGHQSGQSPRSIDEPVNTILAQGREYLIEPFILPREGFYRGNKARSIDDPLQTITAARGGGHIVQPFITRFHGGSDSAKRNHSVDEPLPVIDTSNRYAVVEPFITAIGQASAKDRSRSLDKPLSTVVTKQEHCLVEPFLINYYGNGGAYSVDDPLGTVTTKDRFALVSPCGKYLLDIMFRMLQPHELAAAQGFPKDYKFCGTKTDITKQIGNAVPVNLSRELAETILMTEAA